MNLKPCPFCTAQPISRRVETGVPGMEDCGYWAVECRDCGNGVPARFVGVHADNQESAEYCWNARSAVPEAISAWISVEERLPTESGWYQIWHTAMPSALNRSEQPAAFFYTTSPYWRYTGGGKVTHWMPLPLPPSPHRSAT